jgi:hypothetical protein
VHCLKPATHEVPIVKVKGYTVRRVAVPFCDACAALRQHKSRRQALFERAAVANSILLALAAGAWIYSFVTSEEVFHGEAGWAWGLVLGVLIALIAFGSLYLLIRPWSRRFRSPETKAALNAVTIRDFDWETTTLSFADEEYASQFGQVNGKKAEEGHPSDGQGIVA